MENVSQLTGDFVNYRAMDDGLKLMAELCAKLTGSGTDIALSVSGIPWQRSTVT
jgi:hypothetical protein